MLAIVLGIQKYHTYLYANTFIIVADHKPLVITRTKPLNSVTPRLQCILLKIQGYHYYPTYRRSSDMILVDTPSRLTNPENNKAIALDERVDSVGTEVEDDQTIAMNSLSLEKQKLLRNETARDPSVNFIKEIMYQAWPDIIRDVPADIWSYWSFRDDLAVESGILFKGRQILTSEFIRDDILHH